MMAASVAQVLTVELLPKVLVLKLNWNSIKMLLTYRVCPALMVP